MLVHSKLTKKELSTLLLAPHEDPTRGFITEIDAKELDNPVRYRSAVYHRGRLSAQFIGGSEQVVKLRADITNDAKDAMPVVRVNLSDMDGKTPSAPYLVVYDTQDVLQDNRRQMEAAFKTADLVYTNSACKFLIACICQLEKMSLEELVGHLNFYFNEKLIGKTQQLTAKFIGVIHFRAGTSYARLVISPGRLYSIYRTMLMIRAQIPKPMKFNATVFMKQLTEAPDMQLDLDGTEYTHPVPEQKQKAVAPVAGMLASLDPRDIRIVLTGMMALSVAHAETRVKEHLRSTVSVSEGKQTLFIGPLCLDTENPKSVFSAVYDFLSGDVKAKAKESAGSVVAIIRAGEKTFTDGYLGAKDAELARARFVFSDSEAREQMFSRLLEHADSKLGIIEIANEWMARLTPADTAARCLHKTWASIQSFFSRAKTELEVMALRDRFATRLAALSCDGRKLTELARTRLDELSPARAVPVSAAAEAEANALYDGDKADEQEKKKDAAAPPFVPPPPPPSSSAVRDDEYENKQKELGKVEKGSSSSGSSAAAASVPAAAVAVAVAESATPTPPASVPLSSVVRDNDDGVVPMEQDGGEAKAAKRKANQISVDVPAAAGEAKEVSEPSPAKRAKSKAADEADASQRAGDVFDEVITPLIVQQMQQEPLAGTVASIVKKLAERVASLEQQMLVLLQQQQKKP
jgi:hypothetical protein